MKYIVYALIKNLRFQIVPMYAIQFLLCNDKTFNWNLPAYFTCYNFTQFFSEAKFFIFTSSFLKKSVAARQNPKSPLFFKIESTSDFVSLNSLNSLESNINPRKYIHRWAENSIDAQPNASSPLEGTYVLIFRAFSTPELERALSKPPKCVLP